MDSRTWSHVDDVIRVSDGLFIMFHDDEGVTQVTEALQGLDEFFVISLVETDRGFIKDVEDTHEIGADLCRETYALGFPTGQGPRVAGECQVVQADVVQEL